MELFKDRSKSKEDFETLEKEFDTAKKLIENFLSDINNLKVNNIIHSDVLLNHMFGNVSAPIARNQNSPSIRALKKEHSKLFDCSASSQNNLTSGYHSNSLLMADFNINNNKLYLLSHDMGDEEAIKNSSYDYHNRIQTNTQLTLSLENIYINIFIVVNKFRNPKEEIKFSVKSGFKDDYFSFNKYQQKNYMFPILSMISNDKGLSLLNLLKDFTELHTSLNQHNKDKSFINFLSKEKIETVIDFESLINDKLNSCNFKFEKKTTVKQKNG